MPKRKKRSRASKILDIESDEMTNLIIATIVTTLIFAYNWQAPLATLEALPLSFLAVVTAYIIHELAHRFTARKLRCLAVYKLWLPGVIFGLLMMLVGIKFILVGAVVISTYRFGRWGMKSKHPSMREIGLISVSGPAANLVLAALFKAFSESALSSPTFGYLALINAWFAFFNLVPVKPLDGSKVFFWNPVIWLFFILFSLLLLMPSHIFGPLFMSLA